MDQARRALQQSGAPDREWSVGDPQDGLSAGPEADKAFEEFVRGRSTHLFRLALVITGWNSAAAEDVLQIALERAYRRRRSLFATGSAEPYIRRVVVNAAIDWRRVLRRRAELPLDNAAEVGVHDQTGLLAERDALVRALAGLPPRQRAVLVLRYWADLSDTEIAQALGCTQGTVRSQASRGLARLRQFAGDQGGVRSANSSGVEGHD
jgi:RNA polymerase sigma-70 factor (sigma-E family)